MSPESIQYNLILFMAIILFLYKKEGKAHIEENDSPTCQTFRLYPNFSVIFTKWSKRERTLE